MQSHPPGSACLNVCSILLSITQRDSTSNKSRHPSVANNSQTKSDVLKSPRIWTPQGSAKTHFYTCFTQLSFYIKIKKMPPPPHPYLSPPLFCCSESTGFLAIVFKGRGSHIARGLWLGNTYVNEMSIGGCGVHVLAINNWEGMGEPGGGEGVGCLGKWRADEDVCSTMWWSQSLKVETPLWARTLNKRCHAKWANYTRL